MTEHQPRPQQPHDAAATIRAISMELTALSETGLTYAKDHFDIGRFERIGELAHELMALVSRQPPAEYLRDVATDDGYTTPKVDVRGAIFNDDGQVLLVRERIDHDRWTMPGGWCDILERPSSAIEREIREEAGIDAHAYHFAMLVDRDAWPHRPIYDRSIYKLFFLCEARGPVDLSFTSDETSEVAWHDVDALPELSIGRVLPEQIRMLRDQWRNPGPAHFD